MFFVYIFSLFMHQRPAIHFLSKMLSFNVKINEKVFEIKDVEGSMSVDEAKSLVENISGVPKANQKWIYKGRVLTDGTSLSESNIVDGNTVIVMRAAPTSAPVNVPTASSSTAIAQQMGSSDFLTRPSHPTVQFDNAMFELLQCPDESAVQAAIFLLLKIISNIISHPLEEKYRRLNRSNAAFSKKIGSLNGGPASMLALGFNQIGDDWVLVPNSEAWNNIVSCHKKLEKFSQRISDMQTKSGSTAPAETTVPKISDASDSKISPNPQAMQQFLFSLAALQTEESLQGQNIPTQDISIAEEKDDGSSNNDANDDDEEESIPLL